MGIVRNIDFYGYRFIIRTKLIALLVTIGRFFDQTHPTMLSETSDEQEMSRVIQCYREQIRR